MRVQKKLCLYGLWDVYPSHCFPGHCLNNLGFSLVGSSVRGALPQIFRFKNSIIIVGIVNTIRTLRLLPVSRNKGIRVT